MRKLSQDVPAYLSLVSEGVPAALEQMTMAARDHFAGAVRRFNNQFLSYWTIRDTGDPLPTNVVYRAGEFIKGFRQVLSERARNVPPWSPLARADPLAAEAAISLVVDSLRPKIRELPNTPLIILLTAIVGFLFGAGWWFVSSNLLLAILATGAWAIAMLVCLVMLPYWHLRAAYHTVETDSEHGIAAFTAGVERGVDEHIRGIAEHWERKMEHALGQHVDRTGEWLEGVRNLLRVWINELRRETREIEAGTSTQVSRIVGAELGGLMETDALMPQLLTKVRDMLASNQESPHEVVEAMIEAVRTHYTPLVEQESLLQRVLPGTENFSWWQEAWNWEGRFMFEERTRRGSSIPFNYVLGHQDIVGSLRQTGGKDRLVLESSFKHRIYLLNCLLDAPLSQFILPGPSESSTEGHHD